MPKVVIPLESCWLNPESPVTHFAKAEPSKIVVDGKLFKQNLTLCGKAYMVKSGDLKIHDFKTQKENAKQLCPDCKNLAQQLNVNTSISIDTSVDTSEDEITETSATEVLTAVLRDAIRHRDILNIIGTRINDLEQAGKKKFHLDELKALVDMRCNDYESNNTTNR